MKKCRITVMRITRYEDLMARYEDPIEHACPPAGRAGIPCQRLGEARRLLPERLGYAFPLCIGVEPWRRELLRRLDEKSPFRDAFLQ